MSKCCCGFLLGVLVIVFTWWHVSWGPYILTVLGVVIAVKSLGGICCCEMMRKDKDKEQGGEETQEDSQEE